MRVFLSYRRSDVGGHAGRLYEALGQRLGAKNVFQDVVAISPGQDFAAAIRVALDGCDTAVAVIGPGWLTASTSEGSPRLFDPGDHVRRELATILQRDLPVVPVLVGGASLPVATELPEDLQPLLRHQAIVLRDETWRQDVEYLVRSLRGKSAAPLARTHRRSGLVIGAAVLAAVVGIAFWRPWAERSNDDGDSSTAILPSCPATTGEGWTALALAPDPGARVQQSEGGETVVTVRGAKWRPLDPGRWEVVVDTAMRNEGPVSVSHENDLYRSVTVADRRFDQTCFNATHGDAVQPGTVDDARTGYAVTCVPAGPMDLLLDGGSRIRFTGATEPSSC